MSLLKEKKVCSSRQRSHKDCYDSLDKFLNQTGWEYSEKARDEWLSFIKSEYPSQRYAVWKQYEKNRYKSHDFPVKEYQETVEPFIEILQKHGYIGTTLYLARHSLNRYVQSIRIYPKAATTRIWSGGQNRKTCTGMGRSWN